jgi:hypothetical protein
MTTAVVDALAAAGRKVAAAAHPQPWPPVARWAPIDDKLEAAVLRGDEAEALEAISRWEAWWIASGYSWLGRERGETR